MCIRDRDGAVQDVADFVGDSYALAKKAKNTDADIIVFAGVKFMGCLLYTSRCV